MTRQLRWLLIGGTLLFLPFKLTRADNTPTVQLRTEANPRTITIGDLIKVEIAVVTSSNVTPSAIKLPEPLGEFEVRDLVSSPVRKTDEGKISLTHTFFVTTFSTGPQKIPALSLTFTGPDGSLAETKTEEITIEVKSLLDAKGDEGGLRPVRGLYNFKSYRWLWILLALLTAGGIGFWLFHRAKKKAHQLGVPEGPPIPPEEWAWQALQKLEDSDLIEKGMIKEFYSRLSLILRDYLERRYGLAALERTTAELLNDFRKMNLPLHLNSLLRDFLETGDLVKFAKYTPNEDEIDKDLNRIKEAVTLTTPQIKNESKSIEKEIPV